MALDPRILALLVSIAHVNEDSIGKDGRLAKPCSFQKTHTLDLKSDTQTEGSYQHANGIAA